MGVTRTDLYQKDQLELAEISRALGHPARIAILQFLLSSDRCITGDLVTEIGLAQPTISQHLKVLKDLGIIQGNIEGSSVCYCIDPLRWTEMESLFNEFFGKMTSVMRCC
nr:winged helix-turn-helix transcriptional regulator [Saprospiraceae bacterium]